MLKEAGLQAFKLRDDATDERLHFPQSILVNMPEASFFRQMSQHFVELPAWRVLGLLVPVGYFHLGDVALTVAIPLTSGLPVIEKIRETNIILPPLRFGREQIAQNARMKNGTFPNRVSNKAAQEERRRETTVRSAHSEIHFDFIC